MKKLKNAQLGYDPNWTKSMTYDVWRDTFGKYCWYHEDGTARTQYPLDYNWKAIYDIATQAADLAFSYRTINNPCVFTNEFLALVPIAWLKYKTSMELMSGTLDGLTIDPQLFEQGYERHLSHKETTNGTGDSTDVLGEREDSSNQTNNSAADVKARAINYEQGVQAYDDLNNDNIGEYGNSYASNFSDTVSKSNSNDTTENEYTTGEQTNTNKTKTTVQNEFTEDDKMTRINYYDNLAFLRERMEKINLIEPFQHYFEYLFNNVESMTGFWK